MIYLRISLTVVTETALSVGAGGSAGTLADRTIVRDGWGRPLIPGSQLKGKARHSAEALARTLGMDVLDSLEPLRNSAARPKQDDIVAHIFGSAQRRSRLFFADLPGVIGDVSEAPALRGQREQYSSSIRPSVTINRRRRTAEDARLLQQETALEGSRFHSPQAIVGALDERGQVALLWAALRLIDRWGSAKSRGLGWARLELQLRCSNDGPPAAAAPVTDEATLGQWLREVSQRG